MSLNFLFFIFIKQSEQLVSIHKTLPLCPLNIKPKPEKKWWILCIVITRKHICPTFLFYFTVYWMFHFLEHSSGIFPSPNPISLFIIWLQCKVLKKSYCVWCHLFNLSVSKIAYLTIYLGENVISQFYWSQNLILLSFVIRDCKQWNKKSIFTTSSWELNFPSESTNHPQWDCVCGVQTILEYIHMFK